MLIKTIRNCYDSHTHFWATGQVAQGLKLQTLRSAEDFKNITILPQHFRSDWIVGFGWDQNQWSDSKLPTKDILDKLFPNTPVFLSRVDGHASWINSMAIDKLKKLGMNFDNDPVGGKIIRDLNHEPTGVLIDQAHIAALVLLPKFDENQNQSFFESAQTLFNQAGFTHIRDLSMTLEFWNILKKLEQKKSLTLCIDSFITAESLNDLPRVFTEIEKIKKESSHQIKVHGVKIFVDGSLGSQTAYLSENYLDTNEKGLLIWDPNDIKQLIQECFNKNLEVAVHTIGDQAAHEVVLQARKVSVDGVLGRMHLEHVQLLRPETIQLMKPLHVTCHMQPCHWLSDHTWLQKSIHPNLLPYLFSWELLRKNKIPFYFGSDSPIEVASLLRTFDALKLSAENNIPTLKDDWTNHHAHPDVKWTNSWTEFSENKIKQVYFDGEPLL